MGSSRIAFKTNRHQKEALEELADSYNTSMSNLLRGKAQEMIDDNPDQIPDAILFRAKSKSIKEDEKPYQHAMHIPSNFHEETRNLMQQRFPPTPAEVEEFKYKPYREIIEHAFTKDQTGDSRLGADIAERKITQMKFVLDRYSQLHPDGKSATREERVAAVVDFAVGIKQEEDMEAAKAYVKRMVDQGIVPDEFRDDIYDRVREKSIKEWQEDWRAAARGDEQVSIGQ